MIDVIHVLLSENKVMNLIVCVKVGNMLMNKKDVKTVLSDVLLVQVNTYVNLVLIEELQPTPVHVQKDISKSTMKLYVKNVLANVKDVHLLLINVTFVPKEEYNKLQIVHVHQEPLKFLENVLIVIGIVMNVTLLKETVILVLPTESMNQLVNVQNVLMKLKTKLTVQIVKANVKHVTLELIIV
jgi:hypothetical protein